MLAGGGGGGTVSVSVIGHVVCAGFPSPAQDYVEGNVELPRWMAPNPAFTFLFKVGGHSMIKARIFTGQHSPSHPDLTWTGALVSLTAIADARASRI